MANEPSWRKGTSDSRRGQGPSWRKGADELKADEPAKDREPESPRAKKTSKSASWRNDADDKPSTPTAAWQREHQDGKAPPRKHLDRRHKFGVIATGVFGALVAIILVILWLQPPKRPSLYVIGAGYEQNLAVPANVYGRAAMRDIAQLGQGDNKLLMVPAESVELRRKTAWDDGLTRHGGNTVLLYFAMHGGADEQGPYLIRHDANLDENDWPAQLLRITDILNRLAELPAETKKVVVFDATQMPAHWGLGMLQNQFAAGLGSPTIKEKIAGIPNLVVLSASDQDQLSWASPEWGKTIFAHYLIEGLKGAADADSDYRVSARELYDYTADKVEKWVRANRGQELQTPVKLEGSNTDSDQIELVAYQDYQPPDAGAVPVFQVPPRLREAWEHCHQLAQRNPSPAAYTPLLWRRYLESILRYENLVWAGGQRNATNLFRELAALENRIVREQRLPGAQCKNNSLYLSSTLGLAEKVSADDLDRQFNELWTSSKPGELWEKLKNKAKDAHTRNWIKLQFMERLVKKAASGSEEDMNDAYRLLQVLGGRGNRRPVETHFLAMLRRDLPQERPPADLVARALNVRLLAERVALAVPARGHPYSEQVYPWIQQQINTTDTDRRHGEDRLFANDRQSWDKARELLGNAEAAYTDKAAPAADAVRRAFHIRNECMMALPYYGYWLAQRRLGEQGSDRSDQELLLANMEKLSRQLHVLSQDLKPGDGNLAAPRGLSKQAEEIANAYKEIQDTFNQRCGDLRSGRLPSTLRDIEIALQVPFLDPSLRLDLLRNARSISRGLHVESANRTTEAGGITKERNADRARQNASWQGRMAMAAIGEHWFNDPQFAPAGNWGTVNNQVQNADRMSLKLAGRRIGKRFQSMPTVIRRQIKESMQAKLPQARRDLMEAEELVRLLDNSFIPLLEDNDPALKRRQVLMHDFLLWQADRTWHDHWFPENPQDEPYYRENAKRFIDDAKTLLQDDQVKLTSQQRNARLSEATAMESKVNQPGKLVANRLNGETPADPAQPLHMTSVRQFEMKYRVESEAGVQAGFPVFWLQPGNKLRTGEGTRVVREINPKGKTELPPFQLIAAIDEAKLAAMLKPFQTSSSLRGLYRGQVIETKTNILLHRLPEIIMYDHPAPKQAGLAVTAVKPLHDIYGPSNGAIAIVLDCSESMRYNRAGKPVPIGQYNRNSPCRYHEMTAALRQVLAGLPDGVNLSVYMFGQRTATPDDSRLGANKTISQVRGPTPWRRAELAKLMTSLESQVPYHYTPIVRSMLWAKSWGFPKDFKGFKTMLVLTDGADTVFAHDKDLHDRRGTSDMSTYLQKEFARSGMQINLIGFQLKNQEVLTQFRVIEDLDIPGRRYSVGDVNQLAASLKQAVSRRLQFQIEDEGVVVRVAGQASWDVSRHGETHHWVPLKPGIYDIKVLTDRVIKQQVELRPGDNLLLDMSEDERAEGGIAFERMIYGKTFSSRPTSPAQADWLLAAIQNSYTPDKRLEMMLSLENQRASDRKAPKGGTLRQFKPRQVWLELQPEGRPDHSVSINWGQLYGYPAPAWSVNCPHWPSRLGGATTPSSSALTVYWNYDEEARSRSSYSRPSRQGWSDFVQQIYKDPGKPVGLNADDKAFVEKITFEEMKLVGVDQPQPCLVIRMRFPTGIPVWIKPEGLDFNETGQEHHFFMRANKYTGIFWPVSAQEAEEKLRELHLISVKDFKNRPATHRIRLDLKDPPRSQQRPPWVIDPRQRIN